MQGRIESGPHIPMTVRVFFRFFDPHVTSCQVKITKQPRNIINIHESSAKRGSPRLEATRKPN